MVILAPLGCVAVCPLHHIGRGPPTSPPTPARRAPLGFSAAGNNAPRRVLAFTSDGATPLGPSKHGVEGSATVVLLKHLKGLAETRSGAPSTPRTSHSRVEISAVGQPVDNLALSRPARCAARRRLDTVVGGSQHTPRGDRAAGLLRPTRPRQSFSGPSSRIVCWRPFHYARAQRPLCADPLSAPVFEACHSRACRSLCVASRGTSLLTLGADPSQHAHRRANDAVSTVWSRLRGRSCARRRLQHRGSLAVILAVDLPPPHREDYGPIIALDLDGSFPPLPSVDPLRPRWRCSALGPTHPAPGRSVDGADDCR